MNRSATLASFLVPLCLLLQSCQPSEKEDNGSASTESVPMVPKELQSPAFEPIAQNLDLGGDIYFFVDPTVMINQLEESIPKLMAGFSNMPGVTFPQEYVEKLNAVNWPELLSDLGYTDHMSVGMSSYRMADGNYRNKGMLYLPDGYQGLFKVYEGDTGDLTTALALGTEDTDIFYTFGLNLSALKPVIRELVGKYAGIKVQKRFDDSLTTPMPPDGLSFDQIWENIPHRITLLAKAGDLIAYPMPNSRNGYVMIPKFDIVLTLHGNSEFWSKLIQDKLPMDMEEESLDTATLLKPEQAMPLPFGLTPALAFDTTKDQTFLSTSYLYLKSVLGDSPRLSDSPSYNAAVKDLGADTAQDLLFLSQNFYSKWAETREGIVAEEPMANFMLTVYSMYFPILQAGPHDSATAAVMVRAPDGLISKANWAYSPSMASMQMGSGSQTVVVGGLVAAMAIPAFNKVREQSKEKAIINNLRQVSAAGQQYILENGVLNASYPQLDGVYFRTIVSIAGEDYSQLVVSEEGGTLSVTTADGKTVSYTYKSLTHR